MNPLLADWYHEVSIGASADTLAARGEAIDELLPDLTPSRVISLVSLAHQLATSDSSEWFRDVFKRHDVSFLMRENDREVGLLAGACLIDVSASEQDIAVLAASAVVVASRLGYSSVIPDLADGMEQRLVHLGTSRRQLTQPPGVTIKPAWTKPVQTSVAKELEVGVTIESVAAAIGKIGSAVNASLESTTTEINAVKRWADRSINLCSEESNLMAWLLAGHSETLGHPWSETDPATAAHVAGREIAGLLEFLPAPPQADALIGQMLAATPFVRPEDSTPELSPLVVPADLEFLVPNAPLVGQDPAALGCLSLRQAVLCDVWSELA